MTKSLQSSQTEEKEKPLNVNTLEFEPTSAQSTEVVTQKINTLNNELENLKNDLKSSKFHKC